MGRSRLLIALVAITVVSATAAALIPAGAYANEISIANQEIGDGSALAIDVDGRTVVLHAPEGFYMFQMGESRPPPRVQIRMASTGGYSGYLITITAGPGPRTGRVISERDGHPVYSVQRGHGVSWQVVPGATLAVLSRDATEGQLLDVVDAIET